MVAEARRASWPEDDNLWKIQCFGELVNAPGTPSELAQQLLLKQIVPAPEWPEPTPAPVFKTIYAGVGLIPSLSIGQRWQSQRYVGLEKFTAFNEEVVFDEQTWDWVDGSERVGPDRYLIPPPVYPLGSMSRIPFLALPHRKVPRGLLIPCSEITRTWYFRSTALIHRFTQAPLTTKGDLAAFCKMETSGDFGGNWQVEGSFGLSEADLPVVAMLLCDDLAFRRARGLMDSLVEARNKGVPSYIRSLPPLDGRWRLKAEGQWFQSGGVNRFLVHRIVSAPFPRNPGFLMGDLVGSNNAVDLGRKKLKEVKRNQKEPRQATEGDNVGNEREPEKDGTEIFEFGALPALYNMPVFKKMPPREQTTKNVGRNDPESAEEGDASTGQGNYAQGNPNPMKVKDDQPIRTAILPATFETLLSLGLQLNALPNIACQPVARSRLIAGTVEEPRCLFTTTKRKKQWALNGRSPRQFMVLEICVCEKYVYAVEIDKRPAPPEPKKGEYFAMGLLMATNAGQLMRGDFDKIMGMVAENGGRWSPLPGDILVKKADHRSISVEAFAAVVARKIYEWVPEAEPPKVQKRKQKVSATV